MPDVRTALESARATRQQLATMTAMFIEAADDQHEAYHRGHSLDCLELACMHARNIRQDPAAYGTTDHDIRNATPAPL